MRRAGYSGRLTIVSDEGASAVRPSAAIKEVLREVDDVALKPREFYDEKDIALRLGSAAVSLDTGEQTVTLADGTVLGYDELVIATGLVPRRIPSLPDLDGIRVLRSFDESMAPRKQASAARHAVVVGAGFIGCEVRSASLRGLGCGCGAGWSRGRRRWPRCWASEIGLLVTRLHIAMRALMFARVRTCGRGTQWRSGTSTRWSWTDGTELPADLRRDTAVRPRRPNG
ncbi:FAD-dependent oxidoreductase [Mycolicibacterium novocastrense]|nr:FAD-dependent oxidoreductase [Mycolicibacterium novocastrense]